MLNLPLGAFRQQLINIRKHSDYSCKTIHYPNSVPPLVELQVLAPFLKMKPTTLLLLAVNSLGLASAASIASPDDNLHVLEKRACFKTGANYGSQRTNALDAVKKACEGPLKGTYVRRETRVRCYNIGGNKHVMVTIGLTGSNAPESRALGVDECRGGLNSEIINCGKGGDTTYGRWRYR